MRAIEAGAEGRCCRGRHEIDYADCRAVAGSEIDGGREGCSHEGDAASPMWGASETTVALIIPVERKYIAVGERSIVLFFPYTTSNGNQ